MNQITMNENGEVWKCELNCRLMKNVSAALAAANSALAAERAKREQAEELSKTYWGYFCEQRDLNQLRAQRAEHAEASCAAALPVLTAAREYDTICAQIYATTEPIPGYMLDVARKARLSLSESLMRMDAASSSAQRAPAGEDAP